MAFIVKVNSTNGGKGESESIVRELKGVYANERGKIISKEEVSEIKFDSNDLSDQQDEIYWQSQNYLKFANKLAIFLGGDHSISYSIGKSFLDLSRDKREEACLIIFDSRADLMPRLNDAGNDNWLRALIEEGFLLENILLVGVRNYQESELEYMQEHKIKMVSINELVNDLEGVTDMIMEFSGGRPLYVSLDLSVIDPAFAVSSHPESGGLSSREVVYIMSRMSLVRNLRILDIVELDGEKDKEHLSAKLGAKIVGEFL